MFLDACTSIEQGFNISDCMQSTPGSVADVLWAAAVLDVRAPAVITRLRELAAVLDTSRLDESARQRLFQAHVALERSSRGSGSAEQGASLLPPEILHQARAAWQDRLSSVVASQVCVVLSIFAATTAAILFGCSYYVNLSVFAVTTAAIYFACSYFAHHNGQSIR